MIKPSRLWILGLCLALSACIKDGPDSNNPPISTDGQEGVYIANEGNFQFGNASVSYFQEGWDEAVEDLFASANNRPLGDVCQSLCFFNGKVYAVLNNSGKIEIVQKDNFKELHTISGLQSPRYMLPVSNAKAYVSDLYADAIAVVNLSSQTVEGSIPCPGWTEAIALAYGKAFVTNRSSAYVYVIETADDLIVDSIEVGFGANSLVQDKNGKLWVLSSGSSGQGQAARLHRIDPAQLEVEQSLSFSDPGAGPGRLSLNGGGDTLYYLDGDLYRCSIDAGQLPTQPFIAAEGRNLYGLGIHPQSSEIYLADAKDYVQRGEVYIYRPDGSLRRSFLAGIIPGHIYFD